MERGIAAGRRLASGGAEAIRDLGGVSHEDQRHARHVLRLGLELYDGLSRAGVLKVDGYEGISARELLTVATQTHDIGAGAGPHPRHKRARRMLEKLEPPPGWTAEHLSIVGLIGRCHRGALPGAQPSYKTLPVPARAVVNELAGILRLADRLDESHDQSIARIRVERAGGFVLIRADGYRELTKAAERIAAARHLLEAACGVPILLRPGEPARDPHGGGQGRKCNASSVGRVGGEMERRYFGPGKREVAVIGQGTWYIEDSDRKPAIAGLRRGLDLGATHIDTAEMYGHGAAEETSLARQLPAGETRFSWSRRSFPATPAAGEPWPACERSLTHLKTDRLDCYLLHWPGNYPLEETIAAFEQLRSQGKIMSWGVSNFDVSELEEAYRIAGEGRLTCNQVLYHLQERAIEHGVLPWCESHGIAVVGYSPFGHGDFPAPGSAGGRALQTIADAHQAPLRQVALASSCGAHRCLPFPRLQEWPTRRKTQAPEILS